MARSQPVAGVTTQAGGSGRDRYRRFECGEDVVLAVDHIGGRELEDLHAGLLERVSAMGVSPAVAVARMAQPTAHLDDDVGPRKSKVDASHCFVVPSEDNLALRSGKPELAQQPQESSLKVRLTPRVEEQLSHQARAAPSASADLRQPPSKSRECSSSKANSAVDRLLKLGCGDTRGRVIEERTGSSSGANPAMADDVKLLQGLAGVNGNPVRD